MAKELPYFKFEPLAFMAGDISLESWELQGIFYNLCAFYWSKDCNVSLTVLGKKYKGSENLIEQLVNLGIVDIDEDYISISFLNEQWTSKETQKQINIINGKKGGRPKKQNETEKKPNGFNFANRSDNRNESHIEYNKSKVDLEVKVNEELTSEFKSLKNELCILLVNFFEFNGNHFNRQRMEISDFVKTQVIDESFYNHFLEQFNNYQQYKDLTKEQKHHFNTYLGTQKEAFEDGQWNKENWGAKLEKAKSNTTSKFDRTKQAYNDATNPYAE